MTYKFTAVFVKKKVSMLCIILSQVSIVFMIILNTVIFQSCVSVLTQQNTDIKIFQKPLCEQKKSNEIGLIY